MSPEDRWFYFALGLILGALFGFLVGFSVRKRQALESEQDPPIEVNDRKNTLTLRVGMGAVVLLAAMAAFGSQTSSNQVRDSQKQQEAVLRCTQSYLAQTIQALNERTTYSGGQLKASIDQQKKQNQFIDIALQNPPLESSRVEAALREYKETSNKYVELANKTVGKQTMNPYPTDGQLIRCVAQNQED